MGPRAMSTSTIVPQYQDVSVATENSNLTCGESRVAKSIVAEQSMMRAFRLAFYGLYCHVPAVVRSGF